MYWNKQTLEQRFNSRVLRGAPDECWSWTGSALASGYGQIRVEGKTTTAHRVAWALAHGAIPAGQVVCHKCDNPVCCNPAHLFLGTPKDNVQDMIQKGRKAKSHAPHTRMRKLTDDAVRAIRKDTRPAHIVAHEYGVDEGTVYNVRARRRKALVPDHWRDR